MDDDNLRVVWKYFLQCEGMSLTEVSYDLITCKDTPLKDKQIILEYLYNQEINDETTVDIILDKLYFELTGFVLGEGTSFSESESECESECESEYSLCGCGSRQKCDDIYI